eukprot:763731-Hanusia_phi.AAC.6
MMTCGKDIVGGDKTHFLAGLQRTGTDGVWGGVLVRAQKGVAGVRGKYLKNADISIWSRDRELTPVEMRWITDATD